MREEIRKYADEAFEIVTHAADEIGPRLPGSDNERKFHEVMKDKMNGLGLKVKQEKFLVAPRASIGGIPYAGWVGIAGAIMLNFSQLYWLAAIMLTAMWVWLVCSVFLYKTWFDWCFHHEVSYNTYGELTPEDGEYDYTIMLSGHTDTSWNWKHSAIKSKLNPAFAFIKVGLGAVCVIVTTALAWTLAISQYVDYITWMFVAEAYPIVCPFLVAGSFLVTLWLDKNEKTASPGAMDNATGIALAYIVTKYFKENPDKMPKRCRIIDLNCGAEEAGLRGSIAFVRKHKGEDILKNCYNLNLDSIADEDYFEVVRGDAWQGTKFDPELIKMFEESMKEAGIEKPGNIVNPVGGCDSTPFHKAGVRTVTFAAQDPVMTNYYHTFYDTPDRFSVETVGTGLDVILRVIDKIAAVEDGKRVVEAPAEVPAETPAETPAEE